MGRLVTYDGPCPLFKVATMGTQPLEQWKVFWLWKVTPLGKWWYRIHDGMMTSQQRECNTMFCCETIGVEVNLTLHWKRKQVPSCFLREVDNGPLPSCTHFSGMVWKTSWVQGIVLASKIPGSQSNCVFVGCAGSIQDGSTSQTTRIEGSAAKVLVPDTRGHLQGSCEFCASAGWHCFGRTRKTNSLLGRRLQCPSSSV